MNKAKKSEVAIAESEADEILPEYDFSRAQPNKYASRYQKGSLVITLDPEVAEVFSSAAEANEMLRSLARLVRKRQKRRSKKARSA